MIQENGGSRGAVTQVKRYKFQALVTLDGNKDSELAARLSRDPHRIVVRGRDEEARRSQFFAALVSCDDDGPFRPGGRQRLVTMRLTGDDDVAGYFGIGEHFDLWLGDDIGQGVVTRRLFV
jgi:hypothetical protein